MYLGLCLSSIGSDFSIQSDIFDDSEGGVDESEHTHDGVIDVKSDSEDQTSSPFVNITIDERFLKPLYDGAKLTVLESYSQLLQYSLCHSLTKRAFSDLLKLVGTHLPTGSMVSLYKVEKFFLELYGNITFKLHYCCSVCHSLLANKNQTCPHACSSTAIEFLSIPISNQLKRRLENLTIWSHLQMRFERDNDSTELLDVYDGKEYQKYKEFLSVPENILFLLNTDRVSIFRSSIVSL